MSERCFGGYHNERVRGFGQRRRWQQKRPLEFSIQSCSFFFPKTQTKTLQLATIALKTQLTNDLLLGIRVEASRSERVSE